MVLVRILSLCLSILATLTAAAAVPLNMKTTPNTTKPGCPRSCGKLTVPYPFGVGLGSGCSLGPFYDIFCVASYDPPRAFSPMITLDGPMNEVLDISNTQIRIRNDIVAYQCYNSSGDVTTDLASSSKKLSIRPGLPYTLSPTDNKLMAVGCNDEGEISGSGDDDQKVTQSTSTSCPTTCISREHVPGGQCSGTNGCCEIDIPKGLRYFTVSSNSNNYTYRSSWNPCGYTFIAAEGSFTYGGAPDLDDPNFVDRIRKNVPIVLDWVVENLTCSQAQLNRTTYACAVGNTTCVDGDTGIGGYRCSCNPGYEGNPYLDPGCKDFDECADEQSNLCSMKCVNLLGSYNCSCPSGYSGDGRKDGTGCKRLFPTIPVALGSSLSFILLIIFGTWMSMKMRERILIKRRHKFFEQNGGFLLKQLLARGNVESAKIFTIKELATATNNFSEDYILGKGGYGTVYKGIFPGTNQVVAVKKAKVVDESQIEQFVNELVILARINHPNVVQLLGCCLESEVPLLVYEFISNDTLYRHIHAPGGGTSWLSWSNCLRIATEAAKALSYLHSIPIIHRDIKSTNILLDDNNTAKISDFGISRLIPMDQTRLSTLVQGTLGYLDPEYFLSGQLTNKSDVYSFGVVLAELLTREAPILPESSLTEDRNLAIYFLKSMEASCLTQIVDHQLANEASQDQLCILGELIQSCLSVEGKDRPTMEEVVKVLEELVSM